MADQSCPITGPDLTGIEIVVVQPDSKISDYQEAVALAKQEAGKRFEEYMLVSWYDRDRDYESPPNTTESAGDQKDGYIHYALSHEAKLKVDIEKGRFIFFFAPVEW